jgi:hypothetical protein
MLSKKDLLFNPHNVQPIGSRKGVLNKPTNIVIDMKEVFLSIKNTKLLLYGLFDIYQQNGGKESLEKFETFITLLQRKFVADNDLEAYYTAEWQAIGFVNYVEALKAINNDFHKLTYRYFKWNRYNPFKDDIEVGPSDDRKSIKSAEIMPEDFGTLDLWREQFTQVLNRQFRGKNRIPVHQASIHTRHFDRGNEGLRNGNPDLASLETPIHGYDMSRIKKAPDSYKSESWYSM